MINNDLQSSYVRHPNLWHSARTPVPQVAAVVVQVAEPNWLASRLPARWDFNVSKAPEVGNEKPTMKGY